MRALALLALCGLTPCVALCDALLAQASQPKARALDAREYFGLRVGARWTYCTPDQPLVVECASKRTGAREYYVFKHLTGEHVQQVTWANVAELDGGLHRFASDWSPALAVPPKAQPGEGAELLAPLPLGVTLEAKWQHAVPFQVAYGSGPFDAAARKREYEEEVKARTIHHHMSIESFDQEVKVPAGTFPCLVIRHTTTSKFFGDTETTSFYAREVGLVRRVDGAGTELLALVRFEPSSTGQDAAQKAQSDVDPELALADALGKRPELSRKGGGVSKIERLVHTDLIKGFRARFARVTTYGIKDAGNHIHVVTPDGRMSVLDPGDDVQWQALVASDPVAKHAQQEQLARARARLR